MLKGFVAGVAACVVAGLIGAYLFVVLGMMPANADGSPPALERWAAHTSLRATIHRQAPKGPNPVKLDDKNVIAGIKVYRENCAVCHGSSDGAPSNIAVGLYQHAPQLAKHGVEDDPAGYTYWKVFHGIRMTGMPSFHHTLTEQQIWQVTLFLQNMDKLSPAARKAWKAVPSQAPAKA
jgi:thiosulfate dehydrogenase